MAQTILLSCLVPYRHGLLRCKNEYCQQRCGYQSHLWNIDDLAAVNMKYIVEETLMHGGRPLDFRRQSD